MSRLQLAPQHYARVAILLLTFASMQVQGAPIFVPTGLAAGDTYQLAFVTSQKRDATSTDIADYNAFVQAAGDSWLTTIGFAPGDVTWRAIASTSSVAARDNAVVSGVVYNLAGQVVTTSYADMWSTSLDNLMNITETGGTYTGSVWTGTNADGSIRTLGLGGSSSPFRHAANNTSLNWGGSASSTSLLSLYALSEVLTVPGAPVPAPNALMLILVGLTAMFSLRRRNVLLRSVKSFAS